MADQTLQRELIGQICQVCEEEAATHFCKCTGTPTFFSMQCCLTHKAKYPQALHQVLPIAALSQNFEKYEALAKAAAELRSNLDKTEQCSTEFGDMVQNCIDYLVRYRTSWLQQLQTAKEELALAIETAIQGATDCLDQGVEPGRALWTLATEELQVFKYTVSTPDLSTLCPNWASYENHLKKLLTEGGSTPAQLEVKVKQEDSSKADQWTELLRTVEGAVGLLAETFHKLTIDDPTTKAELEGILETQEQLNKEKQDFPAGFAFVNDIIEACKRMLGDTNNLTEVIEKLKEVDDSLIKFQQIMQDNYYKLKPVVGTEEVPGRRRGGRATTFLHITYAEPTNPKEGIDILEDMIGTLKKNTANLYEIESKRVQVVENSLNIKRARDGLQLLQEIEKEEKALRAENVDVLLASPKAGTEGSQATTLATESLEPFENIPNYAESITFFLKQVMPWLEKSREFDRALNQLIKKVGVESTEPGKQSEEGLEDTDQTKAALSRNRPPTSGEPLPESLQPVVDKLHIDIEGVFYENQLIIEELLRLFPTHPIAQESEQLKKQHEDVWTKFPDAGDIRRASATAELLVEWMPKERAVLSKLHPQAEDPEEEEEKSGGGMGAKQQRQKVKFGEPGADPFKTLKDQQDKLLSDMANLTTEAEAEDLPTRLQAAVSDYKEDDQIASLEQRQVLLKEGLMYLTGYYPAKVEELTEMIASLEKTVTEKEPTVVAVQDDRASEQLIRLQHDMEMKEKTENSEELELDKELPINWTFVSPIPDPAPTPDRQPANNFMFEAARIGVENGVLYRQFKFTDGQREKPLDMVRALGLMNEVRKRKTVEDREQLGNGKRPPGFPEFLVDYCVARSGSEGASLCNRLLLALHTMHKKQHSLATFYVRLIRVYHCAPIPYALSLSILQMAETFAPLATARANAQIAQAEEDQTGGEAFLVPVMDLVLNLFEGQPAASRLILQGLPGDSIDPVEYLKLKLALGLRKASSTVEELFAGAPDTDKHGFSTLLTGALPQIFCQSEAEKLFSSLSKGPALTKSEVAAALSNMNLDELSNNGELVISLGVFLLAIADTYHYLLRDYVLNAQILLSSYGWEKVTLENFTQLVNAAGIKASPVAVQSWYDEARGSQPTLTCEEALTILWKFPLTLGQPLVPAELSCSDHVPAGNDHKEDCQSH